MKRLVLLSLVLLATTTLSVATVRSGQAQVPAGDPNAPAAAAPVPAVAAAGSPGDPNAGLAPPTIRRAVPPRLIGDPDKQPTSAAPIGTAGDPAPTALPPVADPADPRSAAPAVAETAEKPPPIEVKVAMSTTAPKFGDRITMTVTLKYPTSLRVFFPARPNLKPLLSIPDDPGKVQRSESGGTVTETLEIPLLVVKTGLLRTPPVEVPYHAVTASGGAGESGTVMVPSQRVVAKSQFAGATEIKPEPLPEPLPLVEDNVPLQVGLFVTAMMLVAALLTFLGLRAYRNRARRAEPAPEIPPHVVAYGRLDELMRSGRLEDEARLVYGEISEILREYVGRRYAIAALDMTSTELLDSLEGQDLRGLTIDQFKDFTKLSDLVKFARFGQTVEELTDSLRFVRRVVDLTMQTPEELERIKQQRLARLARERRLRIQVMAPAPLRFQAFALDVAGGAAVTFLVAWLSIDTGKQGLFDAAYMLLLGWLALRDVIGGGSPGKVLTGLRIAEFDPSIEVDPDAVLRDDDAAIAARRRAVTAGLWPRLQRNLLLAVPGAGIVAEGLTCLYLPELRRLGDQWAETRVIDGRYGLRRSKPNWLVGGVLIVIAAALLLAPLLVLGGRPL